jgi:molecular chaperone HscB
MKRRPAVAVSPSRYSALDDVTNAASGSGGLTTAQDHFALLGLEPHFNLDLIALEKAWKRVALAVHPDRFATRSAAEKRVAMQWSSQANEAYRILRDPLSRARYLCELAGVDLQTETNTAMSPKFLSRQMSWHEQLDELFDHPEDLLARQRFADELAAAEQELVASVSEHLDQGHYNEAAARVREWLFLNKLIAQCRAIN